MPMVAMPPAALSIRDPSCSGTARYTPSNPPVSSVIRRALLRERFRPLVKRRRHDLRLALLPANFDINRRPCGGHHGRQIRERDILAQSRGRRPAGDHADAFTPFIETGVSIARNAALDHLESSESAC